MGEWIQGWFPSNKRKFPEGVEKTRIIDKEKDSYQEKVKDIQTGKVTHDVEESLSRLNISKYEKDKRISATFC